MNNDYGGDPIMVVTSMFFLWECRCHCGRMFWGVLGAGFTEQFSTSGWGLGSQPPPPSDWATFSCQVIGPHFLPTFSIIFI